VEADLLHLDRKTLGSHFAVCNFANVPNTLQIIVYRDNYHYSANLRVVVVV
jgi:hypothetical protein